MKKKKQENQKDTNSASSEAEGSEFDFTDYDVDDPENFKDKITNHRYSRDLQRSVSVEADWCFSLHVVKTCWNFVSYM